MCVWNLGASVAVPSPCVEDPNPLLTELESKASPGRGGGLADLAWPTRVGQWTGISWVCKTSQSSGSLKVQLHGFEGWQAGHPCLRTLKSNIQGQFEALPSFLARDSAENRCWMREWQHFLQMMGIKVMKSKPMFCLSSCHQPVAKFWSAPGTEQGLWRAPDMKLPAK